MAKELLSDADVRNAKPGITPKGEVTERAYKLFDGGGLFLRSSPTAPNSGGTSSAWAENMDCLPLASIQRPA